MPEKKPSAPGPFFAPKSAAGFTILEIVAVLVILAILTTVAVSRINGLWITAYGDADRLAADLRYAQSLAMTRVSEPDSTGVTVLTHSDGWEFADNTLRFADGQTQRKVKWGVSISPEAITFAYPLGNPETGETTLSLSRGGHTIDLRIHAETGYVEILE